MASPLPRRRFLKTIAWTGALVATARLSWGPLVRQQPESPFSLGSTLRVLSPQEAQLWLFFTPALLDGVWESAPTPQTLTEIVLGVDTALVHLPQAVLDDIHLALSLLDFPLTRRWAMGLFEEWWDAPTAAISGALAQLARSPIQPLRPAVQALKELTMASFYARPESWPALKYPGPPKF